MFIGGNRGGKNSSLRTGKESINRINSEKRINEDRINKASGNRKNTVLERREFLSNFETLYYKNVQTFDFTKKKTY